MIKGKYFNMLYLVLSFVFFIFILSAFIKFKLYVIHKKYGKIKNKNMIGGVRLARSVLDSFDLFNIKVKLSRKKGRNYFDSKNDFINLKGLNFKGVSIYDISVTLNLVGQVILFKEKHFWARLRKIVVFITRLGSFLFLPIAIFGLFFKNSSFVYLGFILFFSVVLLELATIFIEFNIVSSLIKAICFLGILENEDIILVKKVLKIIAISSFSYILEIVFFLLRIIFYIPDNNFYYYDLLDVLYDWLTKHRLFDITKKL